MRASTANILFIDNIVYKNIGNNKYQAFNVYEREIFWLKRFHDLDFIPTLVGVNDDRKVIATKFVGHKATKLNIPDDFEEQLDNINKKLKEYNCQHNDINDDNFLIADNKIYLIDFGWTTFINDSIENMNVEYALFASHEKLNIFPKELNQFFLNNKKLDDDYAFDLVKKKFYEIRSNI